MGDLDISETNNGIREIRFFHIKIYIFVFKHKNLVMDYDLSCNEYDERALFCKFTARGLLKLTHCKC